MLKKISALTVIFIFLLVSFAIAAEVWGSKNSNKYHNPSCRWAQKIKPQNLIKFNSPEEASKSGYIPCKVCRPPVSSKSDSNINNKINLAKITDRVEKQGCCSWHGGWCGGCDSYTGKYICCDGTLSPSCYCQ